jgi:hypothetical protein
MSNNPKDESVFVGMLRCTQCGRKIPCREMDGLRYARESDWPRCCGLIMRLGMAKDGSGEQPTLPKARVPRLA